MDEGDDQNNKFVPSLKNDLPDSTARKKPATLAGDRFFVCAALGSDIDWIVYLARSPSSTFSGRAGSWVMRTPQALYMALMIEAWGDVRGNSPVPDAPNGPSGLGVST
jgi:hypothetical protein